MSTEEVNEEVEALIAILEEDMVEVIRTEDGGRPKASGDATEVTFNHFFRTSALRSRP